ncbi:MAG: DUF4330 domain-containing protein [Oscillospiraceae bacterium]
MKMVDEKGKLFGKINIIDLLILILLVAALALVGWKIIGNRNMANIGETTKITYVARVNGVEKTIADEVLKYVDKASGKKDQLMANGEMLDAYVTDVTTVPHLNYNTDAQGNVVIVSDQGPDAREDLFFTVEAEVENPIVNKVGTQEVRTGKNHIVKTANFEFGYSIIYSCVASE